MTKVEVVRNSKPSSMILRATIADGGSLHIKADVGGTAHFFPNGELHAHSKGCEGLLCRGKKVRITRIIFTYEEEEE